MENSKTWAFVVPSIQPFLHPSGTGATGRFSSPCSLMPSAPSPDPIVPLFYSTDTSTYSVTRGTREFLCGSDSGSGHPEGGNSAGKECWKPYLQGRVGVLLREYRVGDSLGGSMLIPNNTTVCWITPLCRHLYALGVVVWFPCTHILVGFLTEYQAETSNS